MFKDKNEIKTFGLNSLIVVSLTILSIAASVLLAYVTFNEEALWTPSFWIITVGNAFLSILTYTIYRFTSINNSKKNDRNYRKLSLTHSKLVDRIHYNKLIDKLRLVIKERNERERLEAYTKAIQAVTGIFNVDELFNPTNPEKQLTYEQILKKCNDNNLSKKSIKNLFKTIKMLKDGKLYYIQYTEHQLLTVPQDNATPKEIDESVEKRIAFRENVSKFITYFLMSMLITSIRWNDTPANIIQEIVMRLTLFGTSMITAIFSAHFYMGRRKERIKLKNDIIIAVPDIDYKEVEKEVNSILTQSDYE